jgi:ubiquinone/menaquinone biosynthesis C-methylase UbiE
VIRAEELNVPLVSCTIETMTNRFDKSRDDFGPDRRGHGRPTHSSHGSHPRGKNPPPAGQRPKHSPSAPQKSAGIPAQDTSWEHVADWYDRLVGDEGSDYHRNVVLPAAIEMLQPRQQHRVLDLCCGQGVFCRRLADLGVAKVVGIDTSEAMIRAAQARSTAPNLRYIQADARNLGPLADGSFDLAACLMSVHDLDNIDALFTNMAAALKPGGQAVIVMMHPCFRIPRQSSWGWDEKFKIQYRRLDRYASELAIPIATHPGSDPSQHTAYFHRPLATYLAALGKAGLAVTDCRELLSHRQSEPGGRSRSENRARREFPVFLALKAVKLKRD